MRSPEIYKMKTLQNWSVDVCIADYWVAARPDPHNMRSFIWRLKMAWLVFTGKCDVVEWEFGQ